MFLQVMERIPTDKVDVQVVQGTVHIDEEGFICAHGEQILKLDALTEETKEGFLESLEYHCMNTMELTATSTHNHQLYGRDFNKFAEALLPQGLFVCNDETPWDGSNKDRPVYHEATYTNDDGDVCCASCHTNFTNVLLEEGAESEWIEKKDFKVIADTTSGGIGKAADTPPVLRELMDPTPDYVWENGVLRPKEEVVVNNDDNE